MVILALRDYTFFVPNSSEVYPAQYVKMLVTFINKKKTRSENIKTITIFISTLVL